MDKVPNHSNRITLCVVNCNGEKYLEDCLVSLSKDKETFDEILLVDNASQDRSLEIVREGFPFVKVIQLKENRGPGAARNAGFRAAASDRILFLDNDICLTQGTAEELMQALDKNPLAAAAMPQVLYDKERELIQYDGAGSHYLGLMILHHENIPIDQTAKEIRKINSIVTACFLVDRGAIQNGDHFDESFFMYYEDHDFGLRTRISGYEILSVSTASVFHKEGTPSLSLRASGEYAKTRVFGLIRNRWRILLTNYECRTLFLLFPILVFYEVFQVAGVIKKGWLLQWWKALVWIVTHIPAILRKRKMVQKSRKTPDREILTGGPIPFSQYLVKSSMERAGKKLIVSLSSIYWKMAKKLI